MSSLAKIVIVAADGARRTYALRRYPVVIGTDESCDITIVASPYVAPRHIRIEQSLLTGLPVLVDLASGAPTLLHGGQIDRHEVEDRDTFALADINLMFFLPMPPVKPYSNFTVEVLSGKEAGMRAPLDGMIGVGRRSSNRLRVSMKDVSGEHARFWLHEGVPVVEDLGSRNGTYLNGVRLEANRPHPLEPGDLVDLASVGLLMSARLNTEEMERPEPPPQYHSHASSSTPSNPDNAPNEESGYNALPNPNAHNSRRPGYDEVPPPPDDSPESISSADHFRLMPRRRPDDGDVGRGVGPTDGA